MQMNLFARLQLILRAAVGAFGMASFGDIEKDSWVAAPQLHACLFAWAKNAALRVELRGCELDGAFHGGFSPCLDCADGRQPMVILRIAAVDDVEEGCLYFLRDGATCARVFSFA